MDSKRWLHALFLPVFLAQVCHSQSSGGDDPDVGAVSSTRYAIAFLTGVLATGLAVLYVRRKREQMGRPLNVLETMSLCVSGIMCGIVGLCVIGGCLLFLGGQPPRDEDGMPLPHGLTAVEMVSRSHDGFQYHMGGHVTNPVMVAPGVTGLYPPGFVVQGIPVSDPPYTQTGMGGEGQYAQPNHLVAQTGTSMPDQYTYSPTHLQGTAQASGPVIGQVAHIGPGPIRSSSPSLYPTSSGLGQVGQSGLTPPSPSSNSAHFTHSTFPSNNEKPPPLPKPVEARLAPAERPLSSTFPLTAPPASSISAPPSSSISSSPPPAFSSNSNHPPPARSTNPFDDE